MGNLVDCLKKAQRLNKYEKAAILAAQREYLPNVKTSAEADQMAVNSAIAHIQDIISSIYKQAGVSRSGPASAAPATDATTPFVPVNNATRSSQAKTLTFDGYKAWRLGPNPIEAFKDKSISEAVKILRKTEDNTKYLDLIDHLTSIDGGNSNVNVNSVDSLLDPKRGVALGGYFYVANNNIFLQRSVSSHSYDRILAHEYVHAITSRKIKEQRDKPNRADQSKEYKKLLQLYNVATKANDLAGAKTQYGLKNIEEFVAEAFTNDKFQEFLESIPSKEKGTLWGDFVNAIRSMLGLSAKDGFLLKEVLKASREMVNYKSESLDATPNTKEYSQYIHDLKSEYDFYNKSNRDFREMASGPLAKPTAPSIKFDPKYIIDLLEAENNPSVDPNKDQEALPSSAANGVTLNNKFFPPSDKKIKNSGVANLLKDVMSEFWGKVITSGNVTQRELDIITRNGVNEFKAAFADSKKSAADWYSTAVDVAMEVASLIHPELNNADAAKSIKAFSSAEDPVQAANLVMRMAMAITSQNLAVTENTAYANEQYETFVKTGKFNPKRLYGEKAESISGNLELANTLIEEYGFAEAEKFIRSTYSVRDLSKLASDITGSKKNIDGYIDDMVQGAAIFGPKIGQGFLQNLMGNFDPVTIDLWMRRTWGRWTGDVVGDGVTPERLAKLLDAANKAGIPIPNELKNVNVITASRGNGNNYRTIANDTAEILSQETDESTNFRDVINKFAKEVNADWQRQYKLLRQNVTPEIKAAVEAGELSLKQVVDEQSAFLNSIPKKPKEANLKEWRKQQYELAGRTEVIEPDALKALKPKWAFAAKTIISNLNPIDIPSNLDRRVISKVVNGIREALQKEGINVTNADVQAVLWYPEKDIWAKLRGEQESNLKQSYDEEFIKIATERGLGPQANALAESIRSKRAAESAGANRAASTDGGDVQGANQEIPARDDATNEEGGLTERQADLDLQELDDEELGQPNNEVPGEIPGRILDGSKRRASQGSLLKFKYVLNGTNEEKIAYAKDVTDQFGDDLDSAIDAMRRMNDPADRSIVAATIMDRVLNKIGEAKQEDPYLENMYERLLSDIEASKTGSGQALQAQNVVNDILRKNSPILAVRNIIKEQLKEVAKDFVPNAGDQFNEAIVGAGEKAGRVITESKDIVDPKIKEINDLIKTVKDILEPKKATDGLGQQIMDLIHQSAGFRAFYTSKGVDGLAKNFWQLMAGPQAADGNIVTFDRVVSSELSSILRNEMAKAGYENANKPNLSTAEKIAMFLSNDPLKADKIQALDDAVRSDIAQKGEEEGAHLEELWDSIMGTMIESSSSEVTARRIIQETIKDLKLNWNDIFKNGKASIDSARASVINGVLDKVSKVSPGGAKLDLTQLQAQLGPIFDEIASVRQNRFDKNLAMAEARKVANDDPKVQALSIINKLNKQQSFVGPNEISKANPLKNAIADYLNGKIDADKFQEIMTSLGLPDETTNSLLSAVDEQKSINEAWKQIDKSNDLSEFLSKYENYLKPIRSIARSLGINLKEVFSGSVKTIDEARTEIQLALENSDKFNSLSEKDRASIEGNFFKAWEKIRDDIAQKEFNRLTAVVAISKNTKIKEALKKSYKNLILYSNLGLLDNDQFIKALGEQYDIDGLNSDSVKRIAALTKEAALLKDGPAKNFVNQKIMDAIMEVRGASVSELLNDMWFRNVMSAPRTGTEILLGGILQGAARTLLSALDLKAVKGNPLMSAALIYMYIEDAIAGMGLGLDLIWTGDRTISPRFQDRFDDQMKKLEGGKSPGGYLESAYRNATGLKKAALAPHEMLGRFLTALDYVGGQGVRSQQMLYAALVANDKKGVDELMRRFNKAERKKAQDRAVSELGPNPRWAQIRVRTMDILSEKVSEDVKKFGNKMTEVTALNAPPIGIGGIVYSQISRLPFIAKAPVGLAFAKSAINLAQEISNWTPIFGQVNAYRTTTADPMFAGLKGKELHEARARQIFTAQVVGLSVSLTAYYLFLGRYDDDDKDEKKKLRSLDITGSFKDYTPAQRKAAATAGLKEYSIIKNGRSWDYKQFPFSANLAMIGHVRDQQRFKNKKWDEETIVNKIISSWMNGVAAVKELSMTQQVSKLFGFLNNEGKESTPESMKDFLITSIGSTATGIIPFSSGFREVDNYFNQERYEVDHKNPGLNLFFAQVPFVGSSGLLGERPRLNFWGDVIKENVNPINRHVGPPPSNDPLIKEFANGFALGMQVPSMNPNPQIYRPNPDTGKTEKDDLTFEEKYDYNRAVRRAAKRQVTSDFESFKAATPDEKSNYLDAVFTHFSAEVLRRMDLEANGRTNPTEFEDFRKVPVDKNLSSTLTPQYDRVLKIEVESASDRELGAKRLDLDKEVFKRDRSMKDIRPENRLPALQYAINPASYRNALQKKIAGMAPSDAAKYVQEQLNGLGSPSDRVGILRELAVSGALKPNVFFEMAKQRFKAR